MDNAFLGVYLVVSRASEQRRLLRTSHLHDVGEWIRLGWYLMWHSCRDGGAKAQLGGKNFPTDKLLKFYASVPASRLIFLSLPTARIEMPLLGKTSKPFMYAGDEEKWLGAKG
jgi:hypothetical protein